MIDREKVIDELNTDVLPFLQHHCDMQCSREKRWISKMIITVHDTIELLKEQEAVEPVFECEEPTLKLGQFHCGNCHTSFWISHHRFCPFCGKPVKWK